MIGSTVRRWRSQGPKEILMLKVLQQQWKKIPIAKKVCNAPSEKAVYAGAKDPRKH